MKTVVAVKPYTEPGRPIFKIYPFNAWSEFKGKTTSYHIPRFMHGIVFRCHFPTITQSKNEVRLCFTQPESLNFDTFPSYINHEIIPFIWDCWPGYFERVCGWLKKCNVKTAFFTSSKTAELMKLRFPYMNIMHIPEGIDTKVYETGDELKKRPIDMLFYGRSIENVVKYDLPTTVNIYRLGGIKGKKLIHSQQDLVKRLSETKIVAAYPQSWTNPQRAGDIETLTQRYWECMLSRIVMVGHAPKELIELVGYNPVIEIDKKNHNEQILEILSNIEDWQELVDRNRNAALRSGNWTLRIKEVMKFLQNCGYEI